MHPLVLALLIWPAVVTIGSVIDYQSRQPSRLSQRFCIMALNVQECEGAVRKTAARPSAGRCCCALARTGSAGMKPIIIVNVLYNLRSWLLGTGRPLAQKATLFPRQPGVEQSIYIFA